MQLVKLLEWTAEGMAIAAALVILVVAFGIRFYKRRRSKS